LEIKGFLQKVKENFSWAGKSFIRMTKKKAFTCIVFERGGKSR